MLRRMMPLAAMVALALSALACATLGGGPGQPTEIVGNVSTSAAETATALVSTAAPATAEATVEGAPSATPDSGEPPTAEGPTAEAPPTSEPPPPAGPTCAVAYTDYTYNLEAPATSVGNVYCLGADGTPQVLASGVQPHDPRISPDGTLIAYQVIVAEGLSQLWVVSAAGGDARLLVGQDQLPSTDSVTINSPKTYRWLAGTHTLVFDTRYIPTGGPFGPGEYINADLWTVNADTNALTPLLPEEAAGTFEVSPDGQTIAVSRPTGLDLVNADGSNYRQNVITFPAILTYSEYAYKPFVQWSADGTFFNVTILSPDPMAADARADMYRVGVDGIVTPLTSVTANLLFGGMITPAQFAPSGQFAFYSVGLPDGTGDIIHQLEFLAGGGVSERTMGPTLFLGGGYWSPDSTYFAYTVTPLGAPGQGYVTGTTAESVQTFATGLTALRALEWETGTTMVFLAKIGASETWALYRQTLGSEPVLLASGLGLQASMDVRD